MTTPLLVKPGITAHGFRTAVRDYTEPTVIEELGANSYDADAKVVLILSDSQGDNLYIIDDGIGFSDDSIKKCATLGGGEKQEISYSQGKRHFLGSYGYGLKSTLNIASKVFIISLSKEKKYEVNIDWSKLDEALKPDFEGFPSQSDPRGSGTGTGTIIKLSLKNPISKVQLDRFGEVLSNLPTDNGNFLCYYGNYSDVQAELGTIHEKFDELGKTAAKLHKKNKLNLASASILQDIENCQKIEIADKEDKSVTGTFYFGGYDGDKVRSLKPGLRGIYIRIHGRLLKQSFTESKYVYNVSKYPKFESSLRVELSIDWLRNEISLSREGIRFSNPKLETDFKAVISRLLRKFIDPELKKLYAKREKVADRKHRQRLELAKKRSELKTDVLIANIDSGFGFKPETDGELALLLAQKDIVRKISKDFSLIDYNDQAPFDAIIYDATRRDFIYAELEPTLIEFLEHKEKEQVQMIIVWTLGKWRTGAKKKGKGGHFELINEKPAQSGRYRLLEYAGASSKKPRKDYSVMVVEELITS